MISDVARAEDWRLPSTEEQWQQERSTQPGWWWATLIGPPLSAALLLAWLAAAYGFEFVEAVVPRALISFFMVGRFAILEPTATMSAGALALMVIYLDVAAAVFCASHVSFLFGLPWVGRRLKLLVEDSEELTASGRGRLSLTFLGLVAFVFIPITATGSVGGAVLGRFLGLSRLMTIGAVITGSVLCSGLMYFGATLLRDWVDPEATGLKVAGGAVVLGLILVLNRRYRRARERARERRQHD